MSEAKAAPRMPDECGVPDHMAFMHPALKENYGQWAWHDRMRPGVLHHVAKNGNEVWTIKAGTARQLSVHTIRLLANIADEMAGGHVRFTTRSNIEFMVTSEAEVAPLIERLESEGFPIGGTGNSVSMISHTQGFIHCDIPATDAAGMFKSLMDLLYHEFTHEEMPNRVKITSSCCQINCGGQGDISINIQHTKPPLINHDLVANMCERPAVVARCPVAAIRPAVVNGKPTLEVDEKKCICCGACFPPCPPMAINHPEHSKIAIWVGGKHSSTRTKPAFHKLVTAGLPNNPPRWPEAGAAVMSILKAYKEGGKPWERMGEWIDRIGWPRFFEETNLPFTKYHIEDWRGGRSSLNASSHIHL